MDKLTTADLLSLEQYHKERARMRADVLAHKRNRHVALGPHLTLYFEDRITMRYQIQEMLRAERIFESEAIAEELAAYNPLIPDGTNLKATMMLEYADAAQRRLALGQLKGIEDLVYLEVGDRTPGESAIARVAQGLASTRVSDRPGVVAHRNRQSRSRSCSRKIAGCASF